MFVGSAFLGRDTTPPLGDFLALWGPNSGLKNHVKNGVSGVFDGHNECIGGFERGCSEQSIGVVCVVGFAAGRTSGCHATMAVEPIFKAYLGTPCHTSKFCMRFFYKPLHGDLTTTGQSGHNTGGACGIKHGRHSMQHNAIAAVSIVRKFCRVRWAVRTTASNSGDINTRCHWQNSASGHGTQTHTHTHV